MRAERASPTTWLLATLAAWAALGWLLALAGMAGRVAALPEDNALLQVLPRPERPPAERLGPFPRYSEIAARPLFSDDRKPKPFSLGGNDDEEAVKSFDYLLTSVMITPQVKLAILQPSEGGESVPIKLGELSDQAAGWRLASVQARSAVFEGPEGERKLELRAFDGKGGAPATPASPSADDPNRRAAAPSPAPGGRAAPPVDAAEDAASAAANAANAPPQPKPPKVAAEATPDAQIEAIRKRIQARREQLRREAQQPNPPATDTP